MNEKALTAWLGRWEVERKDSKGNVIEVARLRPNLITDVGLNMFRDFLMGNITDGAIKYVALGNSTTIPAESDSQLGAEQFRKQVTFQAADQATAGKLYTELYIADTEANSFKTEEIGWFAGVDASDTANTGVMIARVLYSRQKTNLESWTIRRTDTIQRG